MGDTATTTTTVLVRYFAAAAEAAGAEEERLVLDGQEAPTVGALRDLLVARYGPAMARVVANGSFLVDGIVRRDPAAAIGAQVDVLPPFAGG
ncbi:MoaD/ThiS family protein [Agromyces sp. NPDC056523]|uniref:MoaD/ThiS family protein n=1 Tax=Agromyces sp. NPDC056523 TaxID=3345850 RepID=UPI003670BA4D